MICGYCEGTAVKAEIGYVHGDDTVTPASTPGDFATPTHRPGTRINPVDLIDDGE